MLIAFILFFGFAVMVNAFLSLRSGQQALILTSFMLIADYGASLTIQFYSYPPDRQVWLCLLNLGILLSFISNRKLYERNTFLKTAIPLGYMVMTALNVMVIASRGATWAISVCEMVSDVVFLALMLVNLIAGWRGANIIVGHGADPRSGDILLRDNHSGGRRK